MRTAAVLTAVLGLAYPATATAHFLKHGHLTTRQHVRYFERSVAHDRAQVARDQHMLRQLHDARYQQIVGARPLYRLISHRARWHRVAFRWHVKQLQRWQAKAERQALPAHTRGWLCIHGGEGAWNANTGNGFYGGLQMTYGWMGLVSNAAVLSPAQQMQAAEIGYRNSGFSDSWMRGQWPNTYPPCANLF